MPNFPGINANAIFSDAWAPGAQGFNSAINYYQKLLMQNGMGNGLPALATGRAQSGVGAQYQSTPYNPSQGSGLEAYSGIKGGETAARSTGRDVGNQAQQVGIQGATSAADAYGNSLISHIQGTIAQNQATSQANAGALSMLTNLLGPLFDPKGIGGAGIGALLGPAGAAAGAAGGAGAAGVAAGGAGVDMMSMLTALAAGA